MTNKPAKIPEVRIYFSWLAYDTVSTEMVKLHEPDWKLLPAEKYTEFTENYAREWAKYADKILPALVGVLGVRFYQSVIDAACVPWVRAISDPLTLNFRYMPDQFVDALTHELCHILLTDNDIYSIKSSEREVWLNERWVKLFGQEHDFTTVAHIPVHALCKYIYLDILKEPGRLERDMVDVKNNLPYKAAWGYVNAHDYHEIIAQLRADYAALAAELKGGTIEA